MPTLLVRDATLDDIPALAALRSSAALHKGRLRDAQNPTFRYFVMQQGEQVVGFLSLVFRRPASWLNADDTQHLPEINDIYVAEAERGKGYGAAAIHAMERIAAEAGYQQLYISTEPTDNPRAYSLYQRLGYCPIQSEPYHHLWAAVDGEGHTDRGEAWLVDMVKSLV